MGKSSISKQADKYAEVIVGQIADNFQQLNDNIASCSKLKETLDEYKKAHKQSRWAKFIFEKNIDEYTGYVDKAKKETGCEDYNRIEPLAVGLFGEWGSGKTHQLKLIKHNILYPPKDIKFPQTTIPVFFNAWRFEKEEHMILPLFQTLLQAVEDYEFSLEEKGAKGYRTLSMYLKLGLLSLNKGLKVPDFISATEYFDKGDYKKAIDEIIDTSKISDNIFKKIKNSIVGEQTLTELLQEDKLQSIYLNIPQWIEKITLFENVNFVFLIDDLDRCLPENTLKMLESIKLFLDVPSCAFVLAVDDDVVERGVVHHYRDYLSIYHNKDTEGSQSAMQHELPITGHEYLEKMIQLPIRLPVIDTVNVREFLEECSHGWIKIVDNNSKNLQTTHIPIAGDRALDMNVEFFIPQSPILLDFFKDTIPPKPRKIKRVAKLFETKLKLLEANELLDKVDYMFVAKLTLLELFAPKLLRYIQNQGYGLIFNTLCFFREVGYLGIQEVESEEERAGQAGEPMEPYFNSLLDITTIQLYINKPYDTNEDIGYTIKEKKTFTKMMKIVEEHYNSRVVFDLDLIFNKRYDTDKLKMIIELEEEKKVIPLEQISKSFNKDFYKRLFRGGDVDAWKHALTEHKAMISNVQLEELIEKATEKSDKTFNNLPFIANPEWVGEVAKYVNDEDYRKLLIDSHDKRFYKKSYSEQIDIFVMTFSEYDKYCELEKIKKPKDEGWGRGRRPVINIDFDSVQEYIKWINSFQDKYMYFLPGEMQWKDMHMKTDLEININDVSWNVDNSKNKTSPVGMKKDNSFGLYDMLGNVWEWIDEVTLIGGSFDDKITVNNGVPIHIYKKEEDALEDIGFRLYRIPMDATVL